MPVIKVLDEMTWGNLSNFAWDMDDKPKKESKENLEHICKEYNLNRDELTEEMIYELYDYTDCDTEVIAKIIDKYWQGTYHVEYVDDNNMGYIRALKVEV